MQDKVVEELFKAYFENKKDISLTSILVECGIKAGLGNEQEITKYLETDSGS